MQDIRDRDVPPPDGAPPVARDPGRGPVWIARHNGRREIRSTSRKVARVAAWLTAATVVVGMVSWAAAAWNLTDPCMRLAGVPAGEGCSEPPEAFQWLQAVIAGAGLIAGTVGVVYLAHIGATGRTFRRWRGVALTFGALVVAWLAVYVAGILLLD